MGLSPWEILVILLVLILLFGARRLPDLATALGQSVKNFKKSLKEGSEERHDSEARKD